MKFVVQVREVQWVQVESMFEVVVVSAIVLLVVGYMMPQEAA